LTTLVGDFQHLIQINQAKYFMKKNFYYLLFILSLAACQSNNKKLNSIENEFKLGQFTRASELIREVIQDSSLKSEEFGALQYKLDLMDRIRLDFRKDENQIREELKEFYPSLTDSMLASWENAKQLEFRIIDGEKRYFKNSVSNFFRLNKQAKALKDSLKGKSEDGVATFKLRRIPELFNQGIAVNNQVFDPQTIKIDYKLTVDANAVPDGEIIRCWLPYPRISDRLPEVEFINSSPDNPIIAPESQIQRTLYLEQKAIKDSACIFTVSFVIHTASKWFDIKPEDIKNYDRNSAIYKEYTAERLPQITFSKSVTDLAKQIAGNETNPYLQVKKLYYWINDNIPWASALEYSIMPCIPEYVIENKKGDCGMQSLLLISMARSLGIPAKWQSGWYLLPEEINLHDWVEIYYEGVGWVPVDPSFKLIDHENIKVKEYYMHGLDSYRLIVNDDYGRELFPKKKFPRSEPYDFQRGEVEWNGGNLYFNKWDYHMDVTYADNSK
jgi:hypothetical protein